MATLCSSSFLLLVTLLAVLHRPILTSSRRGDISWCAAQSRPYCSPEEQVKLTKTLKKAIERRITRVLNCAKEKTQTAAANATKSLVEKEFFCPRGGHPAELCPDAVAELEVLFSCICNDQRSGRGTPRRTKTRTTRSRQSRTRRLRSRSRGLTRRIEDIIRCRVSCNCAYDYGKPISSECGPYGLRVTRELKEYVRCYTAQQVQLGGIILVAQLISSLLETGMFGTAPSCYGGAVTLCDDAQEAITKILEKVHPRKHYPQADEIECPDLGLDAPKRRKILRMNARLYSRYAPHRVVDRITDVIRCQYSCSCVTEDPTESGDRPICEN